MFSIQKLILCQFILDFNKICLLFNAFNVSLPLSDGNSDSDVAIAIAKSVSTER